MNLIVTLWNCWGTLQGGTGGTVLESWTGVCCRLWSWEVLPDRATFDSHNEDTVSAHQCLRSKLSWHKEKLQWIAWCNWLNFTIREVQHFLPIWLLGSNPRKIKDGYIFMDKQIGNSLLCVSCVAIQDGHFSCCLHSLCRWERLYLLIRRNVTTFVPCHEIYCLESALLSSVPFQSFAGISFASITILSYTVTPQSFFSFSREFGLKGLCCHTTVHGPISCAGTTLWPSWKPGWSKITLQNWKALFLRKRYF